jgi:hypothetical protein
VIIERDLKNYKGSCCATSKVTRNVDLSSIAGVTAVQARSACDCGCAADEIHVQLNNELGLEDVRPLMIGKGDGDKIVQLIQAAIEECAPRRVADAARHRPPCSAR